MSNTYRPIYENDALAFSRDTTIGSSSLSGTLTATGPVYCGASNWTIAIPQSLSSTVTVQVNNSNFLSNTDRTQGMKWSVNPLLNQPSMGNQRTVKLNPTFADNWVNVSTITAGVTLLSVANIPVRYVRLTGLALTALAGAYLWTDGCSNGN